MLMNKLRADSLQARKNRDTISSNLLTSLVSEAAMVGKNNGNRETTDEETLRVVKKFLDNARETRELLIKNGAQEDRASMAWEPIDTANREIEILEKYVPEQLTELSLKNIINLFKIDNPDAKMGDIMKFLQANYAGQYDGKLASQVAKGL